MNKSRKFAKRNKIRTFSDDDIFSLGEKKEFVSSLMFLYNSSMPVADCIKSLQKTTGSKKINKFCAYLLQHIENGISLGDALKRNPKIIGGAYSSLIAAGEESGKLDEILSDISENLDKESETYDNIINSLSYPVFLLILVLFVFLLFKLFILKILTMTSSGEVFSQYEIRSLAVKTAFIILTVYAFIGGFAFFIYKNIKFRKKISELISKIPFISGIVKDFGFMNFFLVYSLAYAAGVPAFQTFELAVSVVNSAVIRQKLLRALKYISAGNTVSKALYESRCFSSSVLSKFSSGETAGKIDVVCKSVANEFEKSMNLKLKIILKLTEPVLMVLIGIIVLYVVKECYKGYFSSINSILGL